ncbi:flagellar basal body protein [Romboutsia sp.]|uniref:flagellar basal body protein n=1 Tax=Romboutsia sp. TaxID=1965302 RepID=UPI003F39C556
MEIYDLMKMSLDATNLRGKVTANNIANINTSGYKRKYVTFEETLNNNLNNKPKIEVKTDEGSSMREDGNNVELENEKINQAATTLQYNALVSLTNTKLAMTKSVISGR